MLCTVSDILSKIISRTVRVFGLRYISLYFQYFFCSWYRSKSDRYVIVLLMYLCLILHINFHGNITWHIHYAIIMKDLLKTVANRIFTLYKKNLLKHYNAICMLCPCMLCPCVLSPCMLCPCMLCPCVLSPCMLCPCMLCPCALTFIFSISPLSIG